jgi:hypothetical protein
VRNNLKMQHVVQESVHSAVVESDIGKKLKLAHMTQCSIFHQVNGFMF